MALVLAWGAALALWPPGNEPAAPVSGAPAAMRDLVARGAYLARAANCIACHSAPSGKPLAGGVPFRLPFGTLYSANITPDKQTGIGNWSDDDFVRAVREGVSPQHTLYPAMPYTSFTALGRDDVLAIKAYLFSRQPVRQPNTPNALAFPFNQRWTLPLWKLALFRNRRMEIDDAASVEHNRGAYLATALGHCGECHTPRNAGYGLQHARALSGETLQGWRAGNITSDPQTGIGRWTDAQLTAYLSAGHAPGRSSASGPMAEVVEHSLQYLSAGDIHALVVYLRSVAPVQTDPRATVEFNPHGARNSTNLVPVRGTDLRTDPGAKLFSSDCAGCHTWNGNGRQTPYASLTGGSAVNDIDGRNVVQVILHGTRIRVGEAGATMPGFANRYSDAEVVALTRFVLEHFGGKQGVVSENDVRRQRHDE
ncbi:cytochrome c [Paraburkholderia sp. 2C]